jgi:hypothetical protein
MNILRTDPECSACVLPILARDRGPVKARRSHRITIAMPYFSGCKTEPVGFSINHLVSIPDRMMRNVFVKIHQKHGQDL